MAGDGVIDDDKGGGGWGRGKGGGGADRRSPHHFGIPTVEWQCGTCCCHPIITIPCGARFTSCSRDGLSRRSTRKEKVSWSHIKKQGEWLIVKRCGSDQLIWLPLHLSLHSISNAVRTSLDVEDGADSTTLTDTLSTPCKTACTGPSLEKNTISWPQLSPAEAVLDRDPTQSSCLLCGSQFDSPKQAKQLLQVIFVLTSQMYVEGMTQRLLSE